MRRTDEHQEWGKATWRRGAWKAGLLALALLVAAVPCLADGPPPRFERLSVDDGLSQSSALSMVQDAEGFLWVGTYDGLNRYDGYEFKVYRTNPDIPGAISDVNVRALLKDSRGVLWIGTKNGGLNRYERETDSFTTFKADPEKPGSLPSNQIQTLFEDASGVLWVGCFGGLARMDRETGTFTVAKNDPGDPGSLVSDDVRALAQAPSGELLVGTDLGLDRLDPASGVFSRVPVGGNLSLGIEAQVVLTVFPENGRLWVGTETDGLLLVDPAGGVKGRFLPGRAVWSILKDRSGAFWAATSKGLALRREEGEKTTFSVYAHDPYDSTSLSNNDVLTLVEDASGIIWAGTYADGLNKLNPRARAFGVYRSKPDDPRSLSGNEISAIAPDPSGALWVGTRMSGLNLLDLKTGISRRYQNDPEDPDSLSQNEITCVLPDSRGRVWVGTADKGLNLLDRAANTFRHFRNDPDDPESLSQDKIWWIHEGSDGYLWIGTSKKGLNRFDPQTGKCVRYQHDPADPESISHDRVRHIFEGRDGFLWIGTNGGLNRLDRATGKFKHWANDPNDPASISNDRVTPILEDPEGYLWVGTDGGLNRFDPRTETFLRVLEKDGLANEGVQGLLRDREGNLWLSTFKGISKYDPATGMIRNYSVRDGLQGVEFWMNAYSAGPDGEMYFGGLNGMNAFKPDMVRWNRHAPPVVFTGLKIMGESPSLPANVNAARKVALSHKTLGFTVSFAALDFSDPTRNRYAYKLEGFDADWTPAGAARTATYTNLDPGTYVFRVKAANDDNVWNEQGASIALTAPPPFWKTWWFRALALTAFALLAYAAYRMRISSVETKRRLLAELVEVRTAELTAEVEERKMAQESAIRAKMEAERAAMAKSEFLARMSHEIRTPINVILGMGEVLAETRLTPEQLEYVRSFKSAGDLLLAVIDDILDFSRIESGRFELERAPFSLAAVIEDVARLTVFRAKKKGLGFSWSLDPTLPDRLVGDQIRLRQVLVNLLGNALKFTQRGEISLAVEGTDSARDCAPPRPGDPCVIRVRVKDTGMGIPEEARERIFELFSQADASTTRKYGGAGLGLAICKKLVELMHGEIRASSTPGQGSEFVFTATLETAEPSEALDEPAPSPLGGFPLGGVEDILTPEAPRTEKGGHVADVLLVEDNRANRGLVRLYLAELPLRLDEAENGEQAVAMRKRADYDLILMDVEMPAMDGVAATAAIREFERDGDLARTPIVALTAHVFAEHRRRCEEAGCDGFISKPMSKAKLLDTLRRFVPGLPCPAPAPAPRRQDARESEGDGDVVYVREKLVNVLPVFLQSVDDGVRHMRRALEEKRFEKLARHGHNLKGTAASFGFSKLATLGEDIQNAAESQDLPLVKSVLNELTAYMGRLDVRYR